MSMFGGSKNKGSDSRGGESKYQIEDVSIRIRELEVSVDRLSTINKAMWEIITEVAEIDSDSLKKRVDAIHEKENSAHDGVSGKAILCGKCNRPVNRKLKNCSYCNAEIEHLDVFDEV